MQSSDFLFEATGASLMTPIFPSGPAAWPLAIGSLLAASEEYWAQEGELLGCRPAWGSSPSPVNPWERELYRSLSQWLDTGCQGWWQC